MFINTNNTITVLHKLFDTRQSHTSETLTLSDSARLTDVCRHCGTDGALTITKALWERPLGLLGPHLLAQPAPGAPAAMTADD